MPASTFERHHATLQQLMSLLAEERTAVENADVRRVVELSSAKSVALSEMASLLGQIRQQPGSPSQAERQLLRDMIRRCMDANRANGALVNAYCARTEARLKPLMNDAPTYGPQPNGGYAPRLFARA